MTNNKRITITAALPYANGPVHIGHLAGVYIPADIYARYCRLKNKDVIFICGSDEHGVPITIKAKQQNISCQQLVDKYHNIIKDSFEKLGISFDIYSRTSSPIHHQTAQEFFKTLYEKNIFIEQTTKQYYDEEAKQFLADRYITGTCPHCNNEKAYGDQCEKCGTSLNQTDLINPRSTITNKPPVLKETKHWFLPLDKFQKWLEEWILEEHKEWKPNVYGQCKSWLDNGLQPRAVTRDLDWGVKIPLPDTENKVLYVWFDAPIGYISATKELFKNSDKWELYWKKQENEEDNARLIHFIGKDNIVFHCIVFPAMLKAEGSYILPDNIPANEFLNLEGEKISTSRNWAIWLNEYLEEFPNQQDVLRYVLCANAPETKDNDFTWRDFQARNNNELVAILGNFVNRTIVLIHKYCNGKIPEIKILDNYDNQILNELKAIPDRISQFIENFKFRDALNEFMSLARIGNKYLADSEPWKIYGINNDKVNTVLNICVQITANLAILSSPFLPFTSEKIYNLLNISPLKWEQSGQTLIQPNHKINSPVLLFNKIEDSIIQKQIEKLQKIKETQLQENKAIAPQKELIDYELFSKIDLRVGTIIEAEKVAKTKKLLKLKIDTGIDIRTVVSGIAEYYSPEKIIGQQVIILVNLQPKKLKDISSQGMILMAENDKGELVFVSPSSNMPNGSEVK